MAWRISRFQVMVKEACWRSIMNMVATLLCLVNPCQETWPTFGYANGISPLDEGGTGKWLLPTSDHIKLKGFKDQADILIDTRPDRSKNIISESTLSPVSQETSNLKDIRYPASKN
ncbi:MAG: hypothetical protein ACI9VI_001388 [Candidatus Azotimanducaceae bacterium]|jgi:hypothetical protein